MELFASPETEVLIANGGFLGCAVNPPYPNGVQGQSS